MQLVESLLTDYVYPGILKSLCHTVSSCLHDRATVRSGAGVLQVPWQLSGVVQKLATETLIQRFPGASLSDFLFATACPI